MNVVLQEPAHRAPVHGDEQTERRKIFNIVIDVVKQFVFHGFIILQNCRKVKIICRKTNENVLKK